MKEQVATRARLITAFKWAGLALVLLVTMGAKCYSVSLAPYYTYDHFGSAVAIDGDTMVVGADRDDDKSANSGSAYVFVRSGSTWTQQQKLTASDGYLDDNFGNSVAISGDTIVVGAERQGYNELGAAYVFVRSGTTWTQQQKLAPTLGFNPRFGRSVSIDGDNIAVGMPHDIHGNPPTFFGSAYVFVRGGATWTQQQKITSSLPTLLSNEFGTSVSISGETLAVGAPRDDHNVTTTGSAYVYVRSGTTWSQQQKITAADGSQDDNFGASVSLSGDTVAVGANRDADNGSGSGSAYVYTRTGTTWTQQQKLTAGDGATGYIFGTSVALDVSTLLVGSPGNLTSTGAAYVYTRSGTTWTQQQKLTAVDGAISDSFGGSVSLSGETAVVGTPLSDALATDSGAAYAFLRTGTTWGLEQKVVAQDAAADDNNGYSVAVSGNTLAVGAPGTNPKGNDSGSVDILERTGPEEVEHRQKLTAGDGAPGDRFGASVDVDLPNLLVGAPGTSTNASTGSAYVFTRGTTTTTDLIVDIDAVTNLADNKISVNLPAGTYTLAVVGPDKGGAYTAWNAWGFVSGCPGLPDGSGCGTGWLTYHTFSSSLGEQVLESNGRFETPEQALAAVTDGTVVTLPTAETVQFWIPDFFPAPENLAGVSVRILATTAWREQQKLIASDGQTGDDFGSSVGLSGSYAVVGAPDNGTSTGAAYVFYRTGTSTWSQLQKLTATDGEEGDSFGTSVAVSGDTAVVGAPDNASSTGAAYVFRTGSPWAQEAKLTDSAGVTGDSFGSSVAVRDGQIVIGSPGTDGSGADSGSAHLFWYDGSTWVNVFELTATDGAAGDSSGSSVAIDGGTSVVGAPHVNVDGLSNVGRVQLHLAPFSDLSVVKSPSPGFVLIGDTLTYTITVTNNGPETSTEVVIQDALPANLSYVSSTASLGTCSESGGTVTCDIGDLGVGVSAQVTIHTTVIAEGPVNNTAQAYGSVFDPSLTNNTSTSFTTAFLLTPVPSLSWLGLVALAAALGGASYLGMRRRRPSTA